MSARRLAFALAFAFAGCTPAPPPSSIGSSPASLAPTTTSPSPATPTTASDASAAADVEDLVAAMAAFVQAEDRRSYLSLVDLSDPIFATEHTRWVDEWSGPHPVADYALQISDLKVAGNTATGNLTVTWSVEGDPSGVGLRTATFAARFTRDEGGGWRYAGEDWVSTEVPHFVIRVAPGLEAATPDIAAELPRIYDGVTKALDHVPVADLEIKVYNDPPALVANTLLSLPNIDGWNEPGEALKLQTGTGRDLPPVIAHELVHFIVFDRAGTQRSRMPWWLDEGVATLVGTGLDGGDGFNDARLGMAVAWEADDELANWEDMAVFEETPVSLWEFVYPQGYAMVAFVTERFGADRRNDWLAAMATEMDIDEATPAELGRSFDQLDAEFRHWLAKQR